jgi:pyruvate/2-oxoglutarate dehydrogenase complex dihydrolipoamide acyltransferase (E2) component
MKYRICRSNEFAKVTTRSSVAEIQENLEMIYQISVPAVADVEEIRVLEWHGDLGHRFNDGDLIVELETHKAIVEVRAGRSGVLRKILSEAGKWQGIGLPLALLSDDENESLPDGTQPVADLPVEFEIT